MRDRLRLAKGGKLQENVGVDAEKLSRFMEETHVTQKEPREAIEMIWNSDLSDSEAVFLLWSVAIESKATIENRLDIIEEMTMKLLNRLKKGHDNFAQSESLSSEYMG